MGLQWIPVFMMLLAAGFVVAVGQAMPVDEMEYFVLRVVLFGVLWSVIYKMSFWMPGERQLIISVFTKLSGLRKVLGKV